MSTPLRVVGSTVVACCVLGSVHAFSVFLAPLEGSLGASRAALSLVYGLALLALTGSVLLGPRLFSRLRPGAFLFLVLLLAALGALIAAAGGSLVSLYVGYSLIFGAANGLGYGFSMQLAAAAQPGREGRNIGLATAAYALGAIGAAPIFEWAVQGAGFASAMRLLAIALGLSGVVCAWLLAGAARWQPLRALTSDAKAPPVLHIWAGYGLAVAAGLMVIGHAAAISGATNPTLAPWIAPGVVAGFNLLGSLAGGRLSDRFAARRVLFALPVLSAFGLAALWSASPALLLPGLAAVGAAYGAIIAVCPVLITRDHPGRDSAVTYGRVFTAWGLAGLGAPLAAGWLFDLSASYTPALLLALTLSLCASVILRRLPDA